MQQAAAMDAWRQVDEVEAILAERLRDAGYDHLPPRWVRHLQALAERPGATQAWLRSTCSMSNASYEMRRLEELGLVTVERHARDRRRCLCSLTAAGVALLAAIEGGGRPC